MDEDPTSVWPGFFDQDDPDATLRRRKSSTLASKSGGATGPSSRRQSASTRGKDAQQATSGPFDAAATRDDEGVSEDAGPSFSSFSSTGGEWGASVDDGFEQFAAKHAHVSGDETTRHACPAQCPTLGHRLFADQGGCEQSVFLSRLSLPLQLISEIESMNIVACLSSHGILFLTHPVRPAVFIRLHFDL